MDGSDSIKVTVRVRPLSENEKARIPGEQKLSAFGTGGEGSLASSGTPRKEVAIGFGHGGRGWNEIVTVMKEYKEGESWKPSRMIIFDAPPNNTAEEKTANRMSQQAPGGRRYKDASYLFDRVFEPESTQDEVFRETALPLLPGLLDGYNATVFAYGATGCGKTHTINGHYSTDEETGEKMLVEKGVIQRTMDQLFLLIEEKSADIEAEVTVSYLEIYNETIKDLLVNEENPSPPPPASGLALRKDGNSKISVVNLQELKPSTPAQIQDWIDIGNKRRRTERTNANSTSSRSHAVLQINVKTMSRAAGVDGSATRATLSIIDLAGSERAAATSNLGARMKEGSAINKSLLALGNCINALCQRSTAGRNHIPYRDSKLTRLLEFSLGGNCKTVMIVCVSPSSVHYEDTQNTLKYANRAKQIKTVVSRNTYNVSTHVKQYVIRIKALTDTVTELQQKLAEASSQSGDAERRKAVEAKSEVERANADVAQKVLATREAIVDGALCQAILFAAEARLRPILARIAEIERSTTLTSALTAEREVLKKIGRADEDLLRSPALQQRIQSADRSTSMFDMVIRMVTERRLDKLDEVAVGAVKAIASQSNLEMELARTRAREEKLKELASCQAERLAGFGKIFAKTMTVMKDAKGRLDGATAIWEGDDSPAVLEVQEASRALSDVAQSNAILFDGLLAPTQAESTRAPPPSLSAPTTTTFHPVSVPTFSPTAPFHVSPPRATPSIASTSLFSAPAYPHHVSTTSTANASLSATQPPHPLSQPPIRAARISLAGNSSFSTIPPSPARRMLKHNNGFGGPSPSRQRSPRKVHKPSTLSLGAGGAKKAFRWKDEAGEGSIDDAKRISMGTSSIEEETEWEDDKPEVEAPLLSFPPKPTTLAASSSSLSSRPLALPKTTNFSSFKTSRLPPSKFSSLPEGEVVSSPEQFPPQPLNSRRPLGETNFSNPNKPSTSLNGTTLYTKPFNLFAEGQAPPPSSRIGATPQRPRHRESLSLSRPISSPAKRRQSVAGGLGPVRSERKRGRTSLIPIPSPSGSPNASSSNAPPAPPPPAGASKTSTLGSGARRLLENSVNGGRSPPKKSLPPSSSSMAVRASLAGGGPVRMPRASIAGPTGPLPGYRQSTAAMMAKETTKWER